MLLMPRSQKKPRWGRGLGRAVKTVGMAGFEPTSPDPSQSRQLWPKPLGSPSRRRYRVLATTFRLSWPQATSATFRRIAGRASCAVPRRRFYPPLSDALIAPLSPASAPVQLRDSATRQLILTVLPSGRKHFAVRYRSGQAASAGLRPIICRESRRSEEAYAQGAEHHRPARPLPPSARRRKWRRRTGYRRSRASPRSGLRQLRQRGRQRANAPLGVGTFSPTPAGAGAVGLRAASASGKSRDVVHRGSVRADRRATWRSMWSYPSARTVRPATDTRRRACRTDANGIRSGWSRLRASVCTSLGTANPSRRAETPEMMGLPPRDSP